jgi:hypothetical protein
MFEKVIVLSCLYVAQMICQNTAKPLYKGQSKEPENGAFMNSCPLYTG